MQGRVIKWIDERGFGFIEANGRNYFVHQTSVQMIGFRYLEIGQSVTFEARETDRGPEAISVIPGTFSEKPPKSFRESVITKEVEEVVTD